MNQSPDLLQNVLNKLEHVKGPSGSGEYTAHCPAHDDNRSSLCISQGPDGKVLLCCQAGCKTPDIVAAVGLKMRDLFPKDQQRPTSAPKAVLLKHINMLMRSEMLCIKFAGWTQKTSFSAGQTVMADGYGIWTGSKEPSSTCQML